MQWKHWERQKFPNLFAPSKDSLLVCWSSLKFSTNKPQPTLHGASPCMYPMFTENIEDKVATNPFLHTEHVHVPELLTTWSSYYQIFLLPDLLTSRSSYYQIFLLPDLLTTRSSYYQIFLLTDLLTTRSSYYQIFLLPELFLLPDLLTTRSSYYLNFLLPESQSPLSLSSSYLSEVPLYSFFTFLNFSISSSMLFAISTGSQHIIVSCDNASSTVINNKGLNSAEHKLLPQIIHEVYHWQ